MSVLVLLTLCSGAIAGHLQTQMRAGDVEARVGAAVEVDDCQTALLTEGQGTTPLAASCTACKDVTAATATQWQCAAHPTSGAWSQYPEDYQCGWFHCYNFVLLAKDVACVVSTQCQSKICKKKLDTDQNPVCHFKEEGANCKHGEEYPNYLDEQQVIEECDCTDDKLFCTGTEGTRCAQDTDCDGDEVGRCSRRCKPAPPPSLVEMGQGLPPSLVEMGQGLNDGCANGKTPNSQQCQDTTLWPAGYDLSWYDFTPSNSFPKGCLIYDDDYVVYNNVTTSAVHAQPQSSPLCMT